MTSPRSLRSIIIPLGVGLFLMSGAALAQRGINHNPDPTFQPTEDQRAVHKLKRQIAAEELALALQLNAEQVAAITTIIKEVQATKSSKRAERQAVAPQARGLMEDYLDELRSNGAPSAETVADIAALRKSVAPDREQGGEMRRDIKNKLRELLSEEQLQAMRSFRPMADVQPEHKRRDKKRERAETNDDEDGPSAERGEQRRERRHKRMQHKKMKRTVKDILLSAEMLEVLTR